MSTIANLAVEIAVDSKQLKKGLQDANKGLTSFTSSMTGANLTALGIAGAIVGIGVASVNAAIKWETAFTGVEKTVDASTTQLQTLEQQLRDMATDTDNPLSSLDNAAVTLARIAEMGGSLGIAIGDIDEFTQTVGMLDMATDLTAESAAMMIGQFANITQMPAEDFDNFGATLVDLGNKMAATEPQILEFAQRIAAAGERAGFTEDEILGFSAAMASVGLNPEAGGSAFTQAINTMVEAVARGGPELDTLAKSAGTTADAFKTSWEADPAEAFVSFLEGLSAMQPADQLATLDALGLTGLRVTDTLSRLAGNTDLVSDALDVASDAWTENTALMTEAEKRAATTEGKMNTLKNNLNELGIQVGEALLPPLNDAVSAFTDLFSNINSGDTSGTGNNILDAAEDIANAFTIIGGNEIDLPDFETAQAGWQTFFDSVAILAQNGGRNINEALNFIAVGARIFMRDIEELASRAQVASADLNNLLGRGSAENDAARTAGLSNIGNIELAETLENSLTEQLAAGDGINLDPSQYTNVDYAALASKITDPTLIQDSIATALAENDQTALSVLLPLATELGIDTQSLIDQFQASLDTISKDQVYDATATVNLTIGVGTVDSSAVAGTIGSLGGIQSVGAANITPVHGAASGADIKGEGLLYVHDNEKVLNAADTKAYDNGGGGSGGIGTVVINGVQDVDKLREELMRRTGIDLFAMGNAA